MRNHPPLCLLRDPGADSLCFVGFARERANDRRRTVEHGNRVAEQEALFAAMHDQSDIAVHPHRPEILILCLVELVEAHADWRGWAARQTPWSPRPSGLAPVA